MKTKVTRKKYWQEVAVALSHAVQVRLKAPMPHAFDGMARALLQPECVHKVRIKPKQKARPAPGIDFVDERQQMAAASLRSGAVGRQSDGNHG